MDGFRALAYVEGGTCRLVSRNWNAFKTFEPLAQAIAQELPGRSAILDGEILHPGRDGRPMFYELMRRRGPSAFMRSICFGWMAATCGSSHYRSERPSCGNTCPASPDRLSTCST